MSDLFNTSQPVTRGLNQEPTAGSTMWAPPPPPKKSHKGLWITLAIIVALAACAGVFSAVGFGGKDSTSTPQTVTSAPAATHANKAKPAATKAPAKPQSIGPGLFLVGTDVQAGKYKTAGRTHNDLLCYWHTAADDTDNHIDVQGVAENVNQPSRVTLVKGQYFKTSGCEPWVKQ